jgi:putative spermidine/putrescine transport system substrate-binding protein
MDHIAIAADSTILELTERYPSTIQVLVEAGFPKVGDPTRRRALGGALTVEMAARLRRIDLDDLLGRLHRAARQDTEGDDVTLGRSNEVQLRPDGDVSLSGLLPCPVRLPILEAVQELGRTLARQHGARLGWSLAAASVGVDSLNAEIARVTDEGQLPDVFVSAGYESFFDSRNLRRFKDRGTFVDLAPPGQNACFGELELRDPDGHFTVLAVVPAVFLVNRAQLGVEPAPRSWEDLLDVRFRGRVALPVGDFDLFNAILLQIHNQHGGAGVDALARTMLVSLHPSQTVGRFAGKGAAQPAVSIVPLFFSKMTLASQAIAVVWPEDGAVISPIFMLVKRNGHPLARQVAELFLSRRVAETLAHRGLFPALHPEVDNRLPEGRRFRWLGWPFVREHDLGALIPQLRARFEREAVSR